MNPDDLIYVIGKLSVEREMLLAKIAQLEARIRELEAKQPQPEPEKK